MLTFYIEKLGPNNSSHTAFLVAEGVKFDGGPVVVKELHLNSTTSYSDMASLKEDLEDDRVIRMHDLEGFTRGWNDAVQDACEGIPFASVGGEARLFNMKTPYYIETSDEAGYLAGYRACCLGMYGVGWEELRHKKKGENGGGGDKATL